ncbi:MAG: alpha/beta fold hydrolase [Actinomycetota bacterium]|nr:alpha/beta fold hydrolase [Actinomycetota bacterium]
MLAGLAPQRRRLVLGIIAAAVAAVLVGIFVGVRNAGPAVPVPQNQPGPILMVPGLGGSTSALTVLADRLRGDGRDVTIMLLPGDGRGDLREQATALQDSVTAVLQRTGAPSVDVVGYSAGGVVARIWVAELGGDVLARRVITLGSPHHGTQLASLAGDLAPGACPACTQLAPHSDVLLELNTGDETPDGPEFVSIWTTLDQTVIPPDSARLDGALAIPVQSVCADSRVSHGQLPSDPLVVRIVAEELGPDPPVQLSTADCDRLS